MRRQSGNLPTYLAVGLAALAAVMSSPPGHIDIDGAILSLLTAEAGALDLPPANAEDPIPITSP